MIPGLGRSMDVIFNGDDFGLSSGINRGIIEAFSKGMLASASIVSNGDAADNALDMTRQENLDLGIHLTLCDERPMRGRSLFKGAGGRRDRLPSRRELMQGILSGRLDRSAVEEELRAQIEMPLKRGIRLTHMDSHQFVHLFPAILPVCRRLAREYGISIMRGMVVDPFDRGAGLKRNLQWSAARVWSLMAGRYGSSPRMMPVAGFLFAGGRLYRKRLLRMLRLLRLRGMEAVEVMLHPGTGDRETKAKYRGWRYCWENDLSLLMDEDIRGELLSMGIRVASFEDILS